MNVIVHGDSESILPQLKAIGFEPERNLTYARQIAGRIPVDKLDELPGNAAVLFLAPGPASPSGVVATEK